MSWSSFIVLYTHISIVQDSSSSTGSTPGVTMATHSAAPATQGGKLAQEIHDEFLVCKICLELYKTPKSLNCLHTFCEQCVESHVQSESTYKKYSDYRDFTCPLCRKRTQLPIGGVKKLPDNFLVANLTEVIVRQRPSKFPFCDICKMINRKHKEAESKCLDCNKLLCKTCVEMHRETKVTKNHSIFDVDIEKDIECKEHPEEVVRFYCEPCETCICVLCTFNEHKDHEISQFGDAVNKYKENIQNLVDGCRERINLFDDQLESLSQCEAIIKEAEQKIHDTAIQFIADVRTREKQLIDELQNLYGPVTMEFVNKKAEMTVSIDSLRNTCNLTEVILRGKDIELLLLKKDVSEKLSGLSSTEMKNLPSSVAKKVNFIPGAIDFGYIQDMDRPLLSKVRAIRAFRNSLDMHDDMLDDGDVETTEASTQTERKSSSTKASESATDSEEEDDDDEEDTEEDETEEEDEEEEVFKPVLCDKAVGTEAVETEEKGVNTRSRSLQTSISGQRRSPPKDGLEITQQQPQSGVTDGVDYASARRHRRRMRERPRTVDMGSYDATDGSPAEGYAPSRTVSQDDSMSERRRQRMRMGYQQNSIEQYDDDNFFSAENSPL